LCGNDVSDCEHQRGFAYFVPGGGVSDLPWCRVCTSRDCSEHSPDQLYRVGAAAIIEEMDVEEVSLVAKPAQPEGRILTQSIDTADLRAALGEEWTPGGPLSCDFCLIPCTGLRRPRIDTHN